MRSQEYLIKKPVFTENIAFSLQEYCQNKKVVIVVAEKIVKFYPFLIKDLSKYGYIVIPFKDGEKVKSFTYLKKLLHLLLKGNVDKETAVCAIGGGTLLDLCGFANSILLRGLKWIAVPTTLLSMADASIGGKTAINTIFGKNLIGSFHFPEKIFIDINFLKTLSKTDIQSGLVECAKCGLIKDRKLFEECASLDQKDFSAVKRVIQKSQQIKISIVKKDPFEEKGERYLLNFGHTTGHSFERIYNYKISHGKCVAVGIIFESAISFIQGFLKKDDFTKIKNSINSIIYPIKNMPEIDKIWENMKFDKKNKRTKPMYVPLNEIGKPALKPPYLYEINFDALQKAFFLVK